MREGGTDINGGAKQEHQVVPIAEEAGQDRAYVVCEHFCFYVLPVFLYTFFISAETTTSHFPA